MSPGAEAIRALVLRYAAQGDQGEESGARAALFALLEAEGMSEDDMTEVSLTLREDINLA